MPSEVGRSWFVGQCKIWLSSYVYYSILCVRYDPVIVEIRLNIYFSPHKSFGMLVNIKPMCVRSCILLFHNNLYEEKGRTFLDSEFLRSVGTKWACVLALLRIGMGKTKEDSILTSY